MKDFEYREDLIRQERIGLMIRKVCKIQDIELEELAEYLEKDINYINDILDNKLEMSTTDFIFIVKYLRVNSLDFFVFGYEYTIAGFILKELAEFLEDKDDRQCILYLNKISDIIHN